MENERILPGGVHFVKLAVLLLEALNGRKELVQYPRVAVLGVEGENHGEGVVRITRPERCVNLHEVVVGHLVGLLYPGYRGADDGL